MENGIIKWVIAWALARLSDRVTWATWISLAAVHLGGVINPAFEPLLINIATAIVAAIGFAVTGKPIFTEKKETSK